MKKQIFSLFLALNCVLFSTAFVFTQTAAPDGVDKGNGIAGVDRGNGISAIHHGSEIA